VGDRDGVEPDQGAPSRRSRLNTVPLAALSASGSRELALVSEPDAEFAWMLQQDGASVGRLRTDADPAILVAGEAWNADVHQSGRGWWAELKREGTGETITYRPRVLSGGNFENLGARYRLRSRVFGGWRLRGDSRGEIARLEMFAGRRVRIELHDSATAEPRLAVLLLTASLAILWDSMTPRVHAGDAGT
jgi:hypothetical protein